MLITLPSLFSYTFLYIFCRGALYIMDFDGRLSKVQFLNLDNEIHFDFWSGNPLNALAMHCPACLLSKFEQEFKAKILFMRCKFPRILVKVTFLKPSWKNYTNHVSVSSIWRNIFVNWAPLNFLHTYIWYLFTTYKISKHAFFSRHHLNMPEMFP